MEKAVRVECSFLKHHYYPHLCITIVLCILSGGFMSFRNLEWSQAAKIMEMYVVLTGIVLMTPLFMPEQDKEIWLLKQSKERAMWKLYLQRAVTAAAIMTLVVSGFIWILHNQNPQLDISGLWLGSLSEVLFLGSIGYFVSGLTNQVVIGYMAGIMYYAANIGGAKYFGPFALFQLMKGETDFWPFMLAGAAVLTVLGIVIREKLSRRFN